MDQILGNNVAISPDGTALADGSYGTMVRLWAAGLGEQIPIFTGQTDRVKAVAFSPVDSLLASGGWGQDRVAVGCGDG